MLQKTLEFLPENMYIIYKSWDFTVYIASTGSNRSLKYVYLLISRKSMRLNEVRAKTNKIKTQWPIKINLCLSSFIRTSELKKFICRLI